MSMFYRPGESSSDDEDSSDEPVDFSIDDATRNSAKDSTGTAEELVGTELTATESVSTNDFSLTNSTGEDGQITSQDDHRSMMLATMLEELTKYKAAEMLNQAHGGSGFTYSKNSTEVQALAKNLFSQSSGVMHQQGWLPPEAASEQRSSLRQQYLTAFNAIGARHADLANTSNVGRRRSSTEIMGNALIRRGSQQPIPFQATTAGQISQLGWEMGNMSMVGRPQTELQLSTPIHLRSHYRSTFEERGLLGKGGFGRVYHTFNVFDGQEYAIKKIPLSQKLSQRYRQGGHQELSQILREVQALAQLDHCNIVRYHATWIEEPVVSTSDRPLPPPKPNRNLLSYRGQLLLDHKPAISISPPKSRPTPHATDDTDDPFERDDNDISKQLWSNHPLTPSILHSHETNPFTDGGRSHIQLSQNSDHDDPTVYVLHVQMSMCQTTLSEYLLPPSSPRSKNHTSSPRHCFHLVPALKILLSILCGLQYIHARGYVHRDIKPSNIFLSTINFASSEAFSEGYIDIGSCPSCINASPRFINPRIGDFGLVTDLERLAANASTQSGSRSSSTSNKAVGTEYYRPPQHEGSSRTDIPSEKLDVFALGVIFLELLWSCGTRMERIELLRTCQEGVVPSRVKEKLVEHGTAREVADMVEACAHGMIDPDPKSRWRCAMVKTAVEGILRKIQETQPG